MNNQTIKLNVSGTMICAKESTLKKIPFFEALLTRWTVQSQPEIFLEQDPKTFLQFLNKFRTHEYQVPSKYQSNVSTMAHFFGVELARSPPPKIISHEVRLYDYIHMNQSIPSNIISVQLQLATYLPNIVLNIRDNSDQWNNDIPLRAISKVVASDIYEIRKKYINVFLNTKRFSVKLNDEQKFLVDVQNIFQATVIRYLINSTDSKDT